MTVASTNSIELQSCIDRLLAGDENGRRELLTHAVDRLTRLTRKMLADNPRIRRWEETDDVFQKAMIRLYRALEDVCPPTVCDFFRFAATQIRRELIDLARHYYGPQGAGRSHLTHQAGDDRCSDASTHEHAATTHEPSQLAMWAEFHSRIENLPAEEREIFDLLWYQGLTEEQAAALLHVSLRTIQRRWQAARLQLHDALRDILPQR